MNVVVSIGGSVLAPDLRAERVREHAAVLEDVAADGHDLGVVVGGGTVAREYIAAGRELGANEIALDALGIEVTRLNARLLVAALDDGLDVVSAPPEDYESASHALRTGELPVMGGVAPAQTTDAVAAALAESVDADLLVYATAVPGVFDADPDADPDATRFEELTASELVEVIADLGMDAGSSAPVDLIAAKMIGRAGVPTVVVDGTDPTTVGRAVRGEDVDCTEVVPDR